MQERLAEHFVLHHGGVLAMHHEDALLDFDTADFVSEDGERIEPESLQVLVALGMNAPG